MNIDNAVIIVCADKLHCDGLIAELESKPVKMVRWDSRRVITELRPGNEFSNMIAYHCAHTDGWRDGECIMSAEQREAWEKA